MSTGRYITSNTTTIAAPQKCPEQESCHIVGAVIGALVAGFILGTVATFLTQRLLRKRKRRLPPKDYDVRECDVNRNTGAADQYCNHDQMAQGQTGVKEHRKLERLIKQSPTSPGGIEVSTSTSPLILNEVNPQETVPSPLSSTLTTNNKQGDLNADKGTSMYSNTGTEASLSQPYEDLYIIPEEHDYETFRNSNSNVTPLKKSEGK